ncbi:MAG: hypothetical protein KC589_09860 [Nanoarchaeota archaeon]|nr:hypothetical protein [Nanoarchaeota archaeon]
MKSFIKINKKGEKINSNLSDVFIKKLMGEVGLVVSNYKGYSLWYYPNNSRGELYYIVKNSTRNQVIKPIKPALVSKHINKTFLDLNGKINNLQEELVELKTKKNNVEETSSNLLNFIGIGEIK